MLHLGYDDLLPVLEAQLFQSLVVLLRPCQWMDGWLQYTVTVYSMQYTVYSTRDRPSGMGETRGKGTAWHGLGLQDVSIARYQPDD